MTMMAYKANSNTKSLLHCLKSLLNVLKFIVRFLGFNVWQIY